jgi:hypothetical protein
MSLLDGKYWIIPTRRQEVATALGKSFKIGRDGKVKKAPRMTGPLRKRIEGKAKREADKWQKKSK